MFLSQCSLHLLHLSRLKACQTRLAHTPANQHTLAMTMVADTTGL
jgi:hypothetical protein